MIKSKHTIWRLGLALVLVLSLGLVFATPAAAADITAGLTYTPSGATVGSFIAASTTITTFTPSTPITAASTITLTFPSGTTLDEVEAIASDFTITQAGAGTSGAGAATAPTNVVVTAAALTIVFTVDAASLSNGGDSDGLGVVTIATSGTAAGNEIQHPTGTTTAGAFAVATSVGDSGALANVVFVHGAIHHFAFAPADDKTVGVAFDITMTAQDQYDNTVVSYVGTPALTIDTGTIAPVTAAAFVGGVRTESVTLDTAGERTITATDGVNGTSAAITVVTAPTFVSATTSADGDTITATFSRTMADPAGKHAQFGFKVDGGVAQAFSAAALNADTTKIDLTVDGAATDIVFGSVVTLSYTAGTVVAADNGILATFADQAVTNAVPDAAAPTLNTATVEDAAPADIVLTYNEALDGASVPAVGDFALGGADAGARTITGVAVAGTTVTVTVSSPILNAQVITISYTAGAAPIQDLTGNGAANLVGQAVTNNVLAEADLTALTENLAGEFDPDFAAGTYNYALAATADESTLTLTATLAGATITYTYGAAADIVVPVASGAPLAIDLNVGANVVAIQVVKAGFTTTDYTLTITRAAALPAPPAGAPGGPVATPEGSTAVVTEGFSGNAPTVDTNGEVVVAGSVTTTGGEATLTIPDGTSMTVGGTAVTSLSAAPVASPPAAPASATVVAAVDFGPDGATFSPAITLTFAFNPLDLPAGSTANSVSVAWYDTASGSWVELPGTVNLNNNTITVQVDHFTTFGIIAKPAPEPTTAPAQTTTTTAQTTQPAQTTTSAVQTIQPGPTTITSTVGVIGGTTTDDESGFPVWAIIVIGIVVAAAMVFVVRYGWNMRHD